MSKTHEPPTKMILEYIFFLAPIKILKNKNYYKTIQKKNIFFLIFKKMYRILTRLGIRTFYNQSLLHNIFRWVQSESTQNSDS